MTTDAEESTEETTLADSGSEEESSIEANTEVSTEGSGEESTAEEMSTETATEAVETEIIETEEEKELETLENTVEEPVAQVDGAEEYGTLENGDFEAIDDNGYGTTTPWTVNITDGTYEVKTDEWAADATNQFLNLYANSESTVSVTQTITNMEAGTYTVSVDTAGESQSVALTLCVENTEGILESKSFETLQGWDTWNKVSTAEFTLEVSQNITIEISGTLAASEYVKIDNVQIKSANEIWKVPFRYPWWKRQELMVRESSVHLIRLCSR